jgi:hypothetical protein
VVVLAQLSAGTALAANGTPAANAHAPVMHAIQQAVETTAGNVSLPDSSTGPVLVTPCTACAPLTLHGTASSVWSLGRTAVTYDVLRRALQASPGSAVLVIYRSHSFEVAQFRLHVRAR